MFLANFIQSNANGRSKLIFSYTGGKTLKNSPILLVEIPFFLLYFDNNSCFP